MTLCLFISSSTDLRGLVMVFFKKKFVFANEATQNVSTEKTLAS
jgi:hypothetical protein